MQENLTRTRAARALAVAALSLLGFTEACTEEPPPAVAALEEPSASSAARREDELAPPAGAEPVRCDGQSQDPPPLDALAGQANEGDLGGAIDGLEALVGAHPGSATARVRLGELLLRTQPPAGPRAMVWFDRGLALHDDGCGLGPRDLWAALEGAAISRFLQDDYAGALPFLRRSLEEWPGVSATRYNFACALCKTGDLDGCARELEVVFAGLGASPDFLGTEVRPVAHYRALASEDPDIAPLRQDATRWARVQGTAVNAP